MKEQYFQPVAPLRDLHLPDNEVHLWRFSLQLPEEELRIFQSSLSEVERSRVDRYKFGKDRNRYIVGRGILRRILGGYLNKEPAQLQIRSRQHGKPALRKDNESKSLQFNLSHSQGLALCIVACDRSVGVDLELIRPVPEMDRITKRFFSPQEHTLSQSLSEEYRLRAFFTTWVCKEAYAKATGLGLSKSLDKYMVSSISGNVQRIESADHRLEDDINWSLEILAPAPGYIAALAVIEGSRDTVHRYLTIYGEGHE